MGHPAIGPIIIWLQPRSEALPVWAEQAPTAAKAAAIIALILERFISALLIESSSPMEKNANADAMFLHFLP
jgi:hypothetical protein